MKNIRRIYGRIAGKQLPVNVPLFLRESVKITSLGKTGQGKVMLLMAAVRYKL